VSRGPIGVFDSGLGGLTVLRSLIDLVPDASTIYFGDTGRFPYGDRTVRELVDYSREISAFLIDRGAALIVVACNSAASAALEQLTNELSVPVVGVIEPGVRAAAKVTQTGRVGVIGTVGTIASGAYQRAMSRIAPDLELICAACPGFVEFVERGDVDSDQARVLGERLLAPIRDCDVDTLVLGCTHYPLLARTIGAVMGRDVVLVSSADETAFEIRSMLAGEHRADGVVPRSFVTSGDPEMFGRLAARFLGPEVSVVERWSWT